MAYLRLIDVYREDLGTAWLSVKKLLSIYNRLQDVKGKVDVAWSADQSGNIIIIFV